MQLDILYEDDSLLAVNKPAGIVVHPTYKNAGGTLLDALRAHGGDWRDGDNPTIVGRLDKDTSGVVVVAKRSTIHAALQKILSSLESEKDYLAVVAAAVPVLCGTITFPLRIDPSDRRRVVVALDGGSPSETQFVRLEQAGGRTLLRCRLITGRRHQLRVHLTACGWPTVGDRVYGEPLDGFARHALHAWRVSFAHPTTDAKLEIEAPAPAEIHALLRDPSTP